MDTNSPDSDFNPYAAPDYSEPNVRLTESPKTRPPKTKPKPCPYCGQEDATPVPYSAWHGRRAPKAIQELRCHRCQCEFNGETGVAYPARRNPLPWFILALVLFLAYIFFLVTVG